MTLAIQVSHLEWPHDTLEREALRDGRRASREWEIREREGY